MVYKDCDGVTANFPLSGTKYLLEDFLGETDSFFRLSIYHSFLIKRFIMTFLYSLIETEIRQQRKDAVNAQFELELDLLIRWIKKYCKEHKLNTLPYATVQRSCPSSIRKKGSERIDLLMDCLFLHDHIQEIYVNKRRHIELLERGKD